MKPFFHWSQWMYWFMHQTSLIKVIKHRKITNWWHFCQHQNQNNTSLQCHSLYAQLKTAETITNKTDKIFVKKSRMHKSMHSLWSVEKWLHFEEFWEVSVTVVKNLHTSQLDLLTYILEIQTFTLTYLIMIFGKAYYERQLWTFVVMAKGTRISGWSTSLILNPASISILLTGCSLWAHSFF